MNAQEQHLERLRKMATLALAKNQHTWSIHEGLDAATLDDRANKIAQYILNKRCV